MKWVTRERPKIDRIACPWLVRRFLDSSPEFLFVPADQVLAVAERDNALPFDVPGVEMRSIRFLQPRLAGPLTWRRLARHHDWVDGWDGSDSL